MKKNQSVKKGFTLIELIVVIAILGILAAVLLPKFSGFTDNARKKSAMSEAKSCYSAMAAYYADNGKYPEKTGAATPDTTPTTSIVGLESLSLKLQGKIGAFNTSATGDEKLFTFVSNDKIAGNPITIDVSENGTLKDVTVGSNKS